MKPCKPENATCDKLALGDLVANQKGGKVAPLSPPIRLILQGVTTPFPVSSFDGVSNRRSFEVRTTPALTDFCRRLDAVLEPLSAQHNCSKRKETTLACSA